MTCPCADYLRDRPCPTPLVCLGCLAVWRDGVRDGNWISTA